MGKEWHQIFFAGQQPFGEHFFLYHIWDFFPFTSARKYLGQFSVPYILFCEQPFQFQTISLYLNGGHTMCVSSSSSSSSIPPCSTNFHQPMVPPAAKVQDQNRGVSMRSIGMTSHPNQHLAKACDRNEAPKSWCEPTKRNILWSWQMCINMYAPMLFFLLDWCVASHLFRSDAAKGLNPEGLPARLA